jgi:hypothetical protein
MLASENRADDVKRRYRETEAGFRHRRRMKPTQFDILERSAGEPDGQ